MKASAFQDRGDVMAVYFAPSVTCIGKCLPRFIKGIYWATGLFLRTPFTEGCAGANNKASPPGRHQEQAVWYGMVWYSV